VALVFGPVFEGHGAAYAQAMIEGALGAARAAKSAPRAPAPAPARRGAPAPGRRGAAPAHHAAHRPAVLPPFFTGRPDAKKFRAQSEAELKQAKEAIGRMLAVRGPRTIQNTVQVFNEAMAHGENVAYQSHLLEAVHPDSTFRSDAESISQAANKFLDDLSLNRGVYDALVKVDVSKADPATRYFMMRTLRDFRRAGVDKDEPTRKRIAAIYEDLVKAGQAFDRNIRTDSRKIEVTGAGDLEGMPEDFLKAHPPGPDGKIALSIETPDYVPVIRYAKRGDVREKLMHEAMNRAYPANIAVLDTLLALRTSPATR